MYTWIRNTPQAFNKKSLILARVSKFVRTSDSRGSRRISYFLLSFLKCFAEMSTDSLVPRSRANGRVDSDKQKNYPRFARRGDGCEIIEIDVKWCGGGYSWSLVVPVLGPSCFVRMPPRPHTHTRTQTCAKHQNLSYINRICTFRTYKKIWNCFGRRGSENIFKKSILSISISYWKYYHWTPALYLSVA